IIATESPEQAKEFLRLLIKEIRVHNRRRIVPTYRGPAAVRALPSKVELAGLEPATSWVQFRVCSATGHDSAVRLRMVVRNRGAGGAPRRPVRWRKWNTVLPTLTGEST